MSLITAAKFFLSSGSQRRLKKLDRTLDDLSNGIASERENLRALLGRISANVAFSFEAMENGDIGARSACNFSALSARHTQDISIQELF